MSFTNDSAQHADASSKLSIEDALSALNAHFADKAQAAQTHQTQAVTLPDEAPKVSDTEKSAEKPTEKPQTSPLSNNGSASHETTTTLSRSELPKTLAQRLQFLRQWRTLSVPQLAEKAQVSVSTIENLEEAKDRQLSPLLRSRLSRIFRIPPQWLSEVETPLKPTETIPTQTTDAIREHAWQAVRQLPHSSVNPIVSLPQPPCPQCGSTLTLQRFIRRDPHGRAFNFIKVRCSQCLFVLNDEQAVT